MSDIVGLDLLVNNALSGGGTDSINLDSLNIPMESEAPRIMPTLGSAGETRTWDGVENMNAEPFLDRAPPRRMADEHVQKKKYEILRKFERLAKLGVPLRKRFTMDSPLDEMEMELEFIRKEKDMDRTVQQFSEWFVTGMGGLEWSSKNVPLVKAFGLELGGLSEAAQMKVGDMEEDFEELYELYGDKLRMHPLVRIPMRTCMMVYMVHLTNQMVQKAPIPNIGEVLKSNPDIARQLATAAMQQQTANNRQAQQAPPPMAPPAVSGNPLAGLQSFMSSMMPPPPPARAPQSVKSPVRINRPPMARAAPPPPPPAREMSNPSIPADINALLEKVNMGTEPKRVNVSAPAKRGGSTGKNSVSIKL
jgi:hypothetical protein